jgi:hypothetical protein
MSATPRPWVKNAGLLWARTQTGEAAVVDCLMVKGVISATQAKENLDLVDRAVNAFDALLAVARASAEKHSDSDIRERRKASGQPCKECEAIAALDSEHPGWLEWSP